MKKILALLLALVLTTNFTLSTYACEDDQDCSCNCEECITEECECPCHQPDPYFGGDHSDDDDWDTLD